MDLFTKEKQTHRPREWTYGCWGGMGWKDREFGIDMCTWLYLKWITNKDLLYSQGTLINAICSLDGQGIQGNGYMYMHGWVPSLSTRNYRSIVNRLSVQFSRSVVSDSLWPHGLQHSRPPWPSPTPEAYSNSCPLSRWCHPTISSSVVPLFSCPQSFPASGSFQMNQLFASGGQGIGVSTSASVLPVNIQDWFPLGWTGWISLLSAIFQYKSKC